MAILQPVPNDVLLPLVRMVGEIDHIIWHIKVEPNTDPVHSCHYLGGIGEG